MPARARPWRKATIAALVALLAAFPARASDAGSETTCVFGGPTPGYRATTLDLPEGSDFLVMRLLETRAIRPVNDETTWHLGQGLLLLDAVSSEIVAFQIFYGGTAAPHVIVERDGESIARAPVLSPDGPWIHGKRTVPDSLPPGRYHVVAFGTGGPWKPGTTPPNQTWGASIRVRGTHSCHLESGGGETFDYDHTHFSGGTQVHVPGAGVAEGISLRFHSERSLVVGLIDAAVQGSFAGEGISGVSLTYRMPSTVAAEGAPARTMGRDIVPFVSSSGTFEFEAAYRGAYPIVAVTGVGIDLGDR